MSLDRQPFTTPVRRSRCTPSPGRRDQGSPEPADGGVDGPGVPGRYPARAGGPWLCRTLVLFLFHAVVVPSGLTARVQPQRWITIWWWNGHSSTQSVADVLPPRALCVVWWTWQPPARWQCRSRSSTALRIPAGTVSAYPISSGRLGP